MAIQCEKFRLSSEKFRVAGGKFPVVVVGCEKLFCVSLAEEMPS